MAPCNKWQISEFVNEDQGFTTLTPHQTKVAVSKDHEYYEYLRMAYKMTPQKSSSKSRTGFPTTWNSSSEYGTGSLFAFSTNCTAISNEQTSLKAPNKGDSLQKDRYNVDQFHKLQNKSSKSETCAQVLPKSCCFTNAKWGKGFRTF